MSIKRTRVYTSFAPIFLRGSCLLLFVSSLGFSQGTGGAAADAKAKSRTLEAEIIDVYAGIPIIDAGKDREVRRGDEFFLPAEKGSGGMLLTVRRTDLKVSETVLRYGPGGNGELLEGKRLKRLNRIGVESTLYGRYVQPVLGDELFNGGLRLTISRGFHSMRPFFGLEFPVEAVSSDASTFPWRLYGGGELNWYFRRLKTVPAGGFGVFSTEAGELSLGGFCELGFSYLVLRNLSISLNIGGAAWRRPEEGEEDNIGLYTGIGFTVEG